MTKVQMRFRLVRPLDETDMSRLSDAHSIYGISRIQLDRDLAGLTVEYDATRLQVSEVEAALRKAGIPAAPEESVGISPTSPSAG
jgi:hypothetical protein